MDTEGDAAAEVVIKKSDLCTEMEAAAPALEARAAGVLDGAVEALFALEKRCRMVRAGRPA